MYIWSLDETDAIEICVYQDRLKDPWYTRLLRRRYSSEGKEEPHGTSSRRIILSRFVRRLLVLVRWIYAFLEPRLKGTVYQ